MAIRVPAKKSYLLINHVACLSLSFDEQPTIVHVILETVSS